MNDKTGDEHEIDPELFVIETFNKMMKAIKGDDDNERENELEIDPEFFKIAALNGMMNVFNIMHLSQPYETCPICLENQQLHIIEGCFHSTCRNCLKEYIKNEIYPPKCPQLIIGLGLNPVPCPNIIKDDVCFELLDSEDHVLFRQKRMAYRYINEESLFPCYLSSCSGSNKGNKNSQAKCLRCDTISCYVCRDIHQPGQSCEMWAKENEDLVKNRHFQKLANEKKIEKNEAMYCPKCSLFIEVMEGGCDGVICPTCQHDICYRTKQSRWGPEGYGDLSGGCRCMVNGIKCHEECKNCH